MIQTLISFSAAYGTPITVGAGIISAVVGIAADIKLRMIRQRRR